MVRLKESPNPSTFNVDWNFNSTMVRLKEEAGLNPYLLVEFQFHYGTIKRKNAVQEGLKTIAFQFHYGTIKSHLASSASCHDVISIPLWYD